jgi:alpha-galactosidase
MKRFNNSTPVPPRNPTLFEYYRRLARDRGSAVVFAFLHSSHKLYPFPRLYLRGLSETATYRIRSLDGKLSEDTPSSASGAYWMQHGLDVELRGDFQAAAFMLERIESGAGQP